MAVMSACMGFALSDKPMTDKEYKAFRKAERLARGDIRMPNVKLITEKRGRQMQKHNLRINYGGCIDAAIAKTVEKLGLLVEIKADIEKAR